MSKGLDNIGFINGLIAKVYNLGPAYVTIFQGTGGELRAILVDDGLEITEYEYAKSASKVRKPAVPGILPSGSDS
jgi:hypothetical protein